MINLDSGLPHDSNCKRIIKTNSNFELIGSLQDCHSGTNCNDTLQFSNGFSCTPDTCVGILNPSSMFDSMGTIHIDQDGNIHFTSAYTYSKLDQNGNLLSEIGGFGQGYNAEYLRLATTDNLGNLYLVGDFGIKKYDSSLNLVDHLDFSDHPDLFEFPSGLAISDSGVLYMSDLGKPFVYVFGQ